VVTVYDWKNGQTNRKPKTGVTPAILSSDFVALLYRATNLQYAIVCMSHIVTLSHKQEMIKLIGHFLFM